MTEYALYAWGNFLYETGLDRIGDWLAPEVLRGERVLVNDDLCLSDAGPAEVDAAASLFEVGDGAWVLGRDLARPAPDGWRVVRMRLVTDNTVAGAEELVARLDEEGTELGPADLEDNPLPFGTLVAAWEDPNGQWDLALVRL
ncbi:hypothetical protein ACQP1P_14300 [Dactylosporangium sp. CA-052675]|uniref:hypothetical protein n=1 Tax=Dactylosporangium sp. CA-052675 TaxID=3239927 RepID=UPI003D8FDDC2